MTTAMSGEHPGHTCVFGLGWGDEGKGKLVDLLCPRFDVVVRYNGGANAGHTVRVGEQTFALHLLPVGALHPHTVGVIGPGVVLDPLVLLDEIAQLQQRGIDARARLRISDRAHLVLAHHRVEDRLSEQAASSERRIGTTARGIGPCYADKMKRTTAVRTGDLLHDPQLAERVRRLVEDRRRVFQALYGEDGGLSADAVLADLETARAELADCITDTTALLRDAREAGQRVLFEGANGMLLDVDHGTYPFVTSSHPGPQGVAAGAGWPAVGPLRAVGVVKAYATRVGAGPFVSELNDDRADRIREVGKEFGTTTGRPRRVGWFDAVASRYTAQLAGLTDLAVMHLDTLSGVGDVGICTAYRYPDGRTTTDFPGHVAELQAAEPVIEYVPGWSESLRGLTDFAELPPKVQAYLNRLEQLVGAPVNIVGVGPDRQQTLGRDAWRT